MTNVDEKHRTFSKGSEMHRSYLRVAAVMDRVTYHDDRGVQKGNYDELSFSAKPISDIVLHEVLNPDGVLDETLQRASTGAFTPKKASRSAHVLVTTRRFYNHARSPANTTGRRSFYPPRLASDSRRKSKFTSISEGSSSV